MQSSDRFQWHPDARLFVGLKEVGRPEKRPPILCHIAPAPTAEMVQQLATALISGSRFALTDAPPGESVSADFLTQTGGSTGAPKQIRRTCASWRASFAVNAEKFQITPHDSLAVLGSLTHSLALYGMLEGLAIGADTHVLSDLTPARQRDALLSAKVGILYATPTQLRLLLSARPILMDVRLILCGGGALDHATQTALTAAFPKASVVVFYGTAETSFITLAEADTPPGSVGRCYPGVTISLRDNAGHPTATDGQIWVRSPYLAVGYAWPDCDLPVCADGFYCTGEIGRLDAQGQLWLSGRTDRQITVGDISISPEQVEETLLATGEIAHCAVFAETGGARGNRLIALVHGADDPELARRLRSACRTELGANRTPERVVFLSDFPLLPSGKPDLVKLTQWLGGVQ